jgi:DNA-binding transcriptional ArsR family regulator
MEPNISYVANLIGDTARSKMLTSLMSGKALTATELSLEAEITPQTASSHLTKLVDGELLIVRKQGRHKYFQLKSIQVAELIEQLLNISATLSNTNIHTGPRNEKLKQARICYDHLAGELGVKLFDSLVGKGWFRQD